MRTILYTGKGGVGKTSIAAATACEIADKGSRVLIMSTDQAHSLSDSFGIKLGSEPTKISENLYGMEIDTVAENEKLWGSLQNYIKLLMTAKSKDSIEIEELLVFPGFEELLSLIKIKEFDDTDDYDVLIVDCAPTGETMSLLKFPDLFKVWMEKIFPIKKKGVKFARPIVEPVLNIPMPDESIFDDIEKLYEKIDELHKLILNKDKVSVRIVTTPEKIVVKEAKRSFSYLHLFDYNVDSIIINKIFPKESIGGYFNKWEQLQKESIKDIEESFKGIPIFKMELLKSEITGYEILKNVGKRLYNKYDPADILFRENIFEVVNEGGTYIFKVRIPFVNKEELDLLQNGDELTIAIKNEKRTFIVPKKLISRNVTGAEYAGGYLNIKFK